jgi:14-3-3 protein epsilon
MEGSADREECVYLAKLAEQAERYDEMVSEPWSVGEKVSDAECRHTASHMLSTPHIRGVFSTM